MRLRDHQTEIRDVTTRRMLVASDREPPDDLSILRLGHEDRRMREASNRAQVPALVAHCPPAVLRREPPFRLGRDGVPELLQPRSIAGIGRTNDEAHRTTTPAPPRRGSPAAASVPSSRISTAAAPP